MNFVLCFVLRLGAMFFRFFPRKKTQRNIRVRTGKEFGGRKNAGMRKNASLFNVMPTSELNVHVHDRHQLART